MKTIISKKMKPKYIEVQSDEFETIEQYQAFDGQIFDSLDDAAKHESEVKLEVVEKEFFWFPMVDDIWYKAKDQEELDFLVEHLSVNYGGRRYGVTKLKPGEWFTHVARDRDGIGIADHFLPLNKLKEDLIELLELLEGKNEKNA